MRGLFKDNLPLAEFVLRIITGKQDLVLLKCDMHYGLLAERTRYLKENSKGVNEMYRTMDEVEKECYEEGREKGRETQAELTAINLRKLGLPLEQIAHAVGFHVEKVEKWVK